MNELTTEALRRMILEVSLFTYSKWRLWGMYRRIEDTKPQSLEEAAIKDKAMRFLANKIGRKFYIEEVMNEEF